MKVFSILSAAAALASFASAQNAVVENSCDFTIWVRSIGYDGVSGKLTTVNPGETFSEELKASSASVTIGTDRPLTNPLLVNYSFDDYNAYYEFLTEFGNPFADYANSLSPGAGCTAFECEAGDAGCYSFPGSSKVWSCPLPVDLTATICA